MVFRTNIKIIILAAGDKPSIKFSDNTDIIIKLNKMNLKKEKVIYFDKEYYV